jgi:hypothetical protein
MDAFALVGFTVHGSDVHTTRFITYLGDWVATITIRVKSEGSDSLLLLLCRMPILPFLVPLD